MTGISQKHILHHGQQLFCDGGKNLVFFPYQISVCFKPGRQRTENKTAARACVNEMLKSQKIARALNSNKGWNVTGCMSFMNQPIFKYTNEIRSAVLIIHGEKAHSCYFSRDAYADMVKDNPYADNKELMIIPDAVHTDLYDRMDVIPFDKMEAFFRKAME